jgi:ADP-heptose:LPS heptosyltransferase
MASSSSSFPILIVAPPTLSEAVLFSGLVKRLADEIPHARFTVLGDAAVVGVYRDMPSLDKTIALEAAPFGLPWLKLWLRLRRRRWGLVLDMTGTRLARSLKARRKAIRKPLSAALDPVHKVIEAAQILRIDDDPPAPFLFASEETEAAAEALLRPPSGAKEGPILALAPAADWVGKTWPPERFAVVAAELLSPRGPLSGGRLMVVGRQEDRWAAEAVRRAIARDRLIDLAGRADAVTTYACLKRARLFIGGDSEMLHLASAAGAPTLGLFGPSDERVWRPWGPQGETLRGPRDFDAIKAADPGLNQAVCHMQDLPVAWVINAARRLLDATEAREAAAEEPPHA